MAQPVHSAATHHLPVFVTTPGETDVLFVMMAFLVLFGVVGIEFCGGSACKPSTRLGWCA